MHMSTPPVLCNTTYETYTHACTYTRTYTHKHIHTQHAQTGVSSVLGLSPAVLGMLRHQSSHPLLLPSLKMAA